MNTSYREVSNTRRGTNAISLQALVIISDISLTVINFHYVLQEYLYCVLIIDVLMQGELLITPKKDN